MYIQYSISIINTFFIGYRFFIGWFSILILFMIMNSYGYKQIGINLSYKTFFNLIYILTYMYMYMPVLSSLFYCVPRNRYRSWSFFWLMHWTMSVTPFLHVVECSQITVEYTCQLSGVSLTHAGWKLRSHAGSRLRANFSRLIEKCELLPSCLTQFPKIC